MPELNLPPITEQQKSVLTQSSRLPHSFP